MTYKFGVTEGDTIKAVLLFNLPPPGVSKRYGKKTLCFTRMCAVNSDQRSFRLRNVIKKVLKSKIEKSRFDTVVTYADTSLGHTGYIYKISGFQFDGEVLAKKLEIDGIRVSRYNNGKSVYKDVEKTTIKLLRFVKRL